MLEYGQNSQVGYPDIPEFCPVYTLGLPGYMSEYDQKYCRV